MAKAIEKMPIRIVLVDPEDRLEFTARNWLGFADRVAFERQFGVPFGQVVGPGARDEWMLWLAWRAANREIGDQGSFEAFTERVVELDFSAGDEVDAVRPTTPTPGSPSSG